MRRRRIERGTKRSDLLFSTPSPFFPECDRPRNLICGCGDSSAEGLKPRCLPKEKRQKGGREIWMPSSQKKPLLLSSGSFLLLIVPLLQQSPKFFGKSLPCHQYSKRMEIRISSIRNWQNSDQIFRLLPFFSFPLLLPSRFSSSSTCCERGESKRGKEGRGLVHNVSSPPLILLLLPLFAINFREIGDAGGGTKRKTRSLLSDVNITVPCPSTQDKGIFSLVFKVYE